MDPTSRHQKIMSDQSVETMLACSKTQEQEDQKKARPQPEQALKCPRCDSTNTKFCYYNNYSLSQPRYFCKSCRRYWTKGGTLRNVPVGGGCRKNKRSSSSSSRRDCQDQAFINTNHHNINNNPFSGFPQLSCYGSSNDFALAIAARLQKGQQLGFDDHHGLSIMGSTISSTPCDILGLNNNNFNSATTTTGFLDALRSGFLGTPNNSNNNVQNLYYGGYGNNNNNNGDMGEVVDNNGGGDMNMVLPAYDQEMNDNASVATTQAVTVTTMKQEICSGGDHNSSSSNNNRVLWGFPWQMNGSSSDHNTNMGEFDSARASCWNNLNPSSWHGLVNSPLM